MARRYEEQFKKQIVALYNNDKSLADINREYGIQNQQLKYGLKDIIVLAHLM